MTDTEIKKALECCVNDDCGECPYGEDECFADLNEENKMLKDTLDLLNRKDAEIERLRRDKYLYKDGKLELLPRTDIDEIKAEAYKDLAEKIKAKKKRAYFEEEGFMWCVSVDDIDAVLKEAGADDGSKVRPIPILGNITLGGDADI